MGRLDQTVKMICSSKKAIFCLFINELKFAGSMDQLEQHFYNTFKK